MQAVPARSDSSASSSSSANLLPTANAAQAQTVVTSSFARSPNNVLSLPLGSAPAQSPPSALALSGPAAFNFASAANYNPSAASFPSFQLMHNLAQPQLSFNPQLSLAGLPSNNMQVNMNLQLLALMQQQQPPSIQLTPQVIQALLLHQVQQNLLSVMFPSMCSSLTRLCSSKTRAWQICSYHNNKRPDPQTCPARTFSPRSRST